MTSQPNGQPRKTRRVQPGDSTPPPQHPAGSFQPGPNVQQGQVAQPAVMPSLDVLQAQFEQAVAANQARFEELARQGTSPDPLYLVHARINSLIDSISSFAGPEGPRWAMLARLRFEMQIAEELAGAGQATQRMQLAEGGRYSPEMIRQLAAQTGMLRPRTH